MNIFSTVMYLVAAGVVTWIVERAINTFTSQYNTIRNKDLISKAVPRNLRFLLFLDRHYIDDFFVVAGKSEADVILYPLGLRPKVPVLDVLYMEFLKNHMKDESFGKLILFPTPDLSSPNQRVDEINKLSKNIQKVFGNLSDRVSIVNTFDHEAYKDVSISVDFLKVVEYLDSEEFLSMANKILGRDVEGFSDFSKHHPEGKQLVSIINHIYNSWCLRRFLDLEGYLSNGPNRIGIVFWMPELAKLGVVHQLKHIEGITILGIAGKTIQFDWNKPLPAHDPEKTIRMFEDEGSVIKKISQKSSSECWQYTSIFKSILSDNFDISTEARGEKKKGENIFKEYILSKHQGNKKFGISKTSKYRALATYKILKEEYDRG